jgi:hypothetical protein
LKEAITFFGDDTDKDFAASAAGAYEKGQRLARIVGQRRALLILDGLEPLQYAPTSPTPGELKDGGITALLKGLAAHSDGLCIVTTRYSVPNLKAFWQTTAREIPLTRLSQSAGVHLLKSLGVQGSAKEFETLVEDVKGHALTLNLLGTYLRDAQGGDIRRRDLIKLEEADAEEQGHAFRVMAAYENAFKAEGEKGRRALAMLRLLGLFDRPVTATILAALLEKPAIPNLTGPLIGLDEAQRNLILARLKDAKLLTINREVTGVLISLDAHPLLREYSALRLRMQHPNSWRSAHRRLYEHLCRTTLEKTNPTLEDLQPLYQAVVHGCYAGLQQDACENIYQKRIQRLRQHYSYYKLGAHGSVLGAIGCFFETPWTRVSFRIDQSYQAWLLNEAAYCLGALGRQTEALNPMRAGVKMRVKQENWREAAAQAGNLSELELILGEVPQAVVTSEEAVIYADRSDDGFQQMGSRTINADALHQAGRRTEARTQFQVAEHMQRKWQPEFPLLYAFQGFRYCDLLLAAVERAAWRCVLERRDRTRQEQGQTDEESTPFKLLSDVFERAVQTLKWVEKFPTASLLTLAVERLTVGRAALFKAVFAEIDLLSNSEIAKLITTIGAAVNGLRDSNQQDELPRGLLTRAWLRFLTRGRSGDEGAQEDLDEAWEIAERGPMRLYMADIHLYRARLFFREKAYPWKSPEADLEAAEKLINECGYHRRDEELADAKRVIFKKSA